MLGTTFNVQAYSNESENTVTLLSGAVELDLLSRKGECSGRSNCILTNSAFRQESR